MRFFDDEGAKNFLEQIFPLVERPLREQHVPLSFQPQNRAGSLQGQFDALNASGMLTIGSIRDAQDGHERGDERALFGGKSCEGFVT